MSHYPKGPYSYNHGLLVPKPTQTNKEQLNQRWKFSHYPLTIMMMVKFLDRRTFLEIHSKPV